MHGDHLVFRITRDLRVQQFRDPVEKKDVKHDRRYFSSITFAHHSVDALLIKMEISETRVARSFLHCRHCNIARILLETLESAKDPSTVRRSTLQFLATYRDASPEAPQAGRFGQRHALARRLLLRSAHADERHCFRVRARADFHGLDREVATISSLCSRSARR